MHEAEGQMEAGREAGRQEAGPQSEARRPLSCARIGSSVRVEEGWGIKAIFCVRL